MNGTGVMNEEETKSKKNKKNPHFHSMPSSYSGYPEDPSAHTMSLADLGPRLTTWLLRPKDNLKKDDNPWDPWFDKCFGFVVRTKDEKSAREYADANAGAENKGGFVGNRAITIHPWLDGNYSTCTQLTVEGKEGIIIEDMRRA